MQRHPRHRGAILVYTVIVMVVMIAFVGLAIDYGHLFLTAQQLQNAADAAALAGAQQVRDDDAAARDAAISLAAANRAAADPVQLDRNDSGALPNNPAGDIVVGRYDRSTKTFTAGQTGRNAVLVQARRTAATHGGVRLFFGPIFGKRRADVERYAIGIATRGPGWADVISLNEHDPQSFYMHGTGWLDVGTGSIQVDSDNTTNNTGASLIQGTTVTLKAGEIDVVGMQYERGKPSIPPVNEHQPYVADPLADLNEPIVPSSATYPTRTTITGSGDFYPGYYPGGVDLRAGNNIVLHPGVYILDNGFAINGHATLTGDGVMFYVHSGSVNDGNGTSIIHLTPPPEGNYYAGIQFFQARSNTSTANFNGTTLWGGATSDDPNTPDVNEATAGEGVFYFPNAKWQMGGTGSISMTGLIADKIEIYGTGHVTVTSGWDSVIGGKHVYLVE